MKKTICLILALTLMLTMSSGFVFAESGKTVYEAEDGILTGLKVMTDLTGYSGSGYVGKWSDEKQYLEIPITVDTTGRYNITVRTNCENHYKENNLLLDNKTVGTIYSEEKTGWQDYVFESVNVTAGSHTLKVTKSWGWIMLDYIAIEKGEGIPDSIYDINYALSNKNANDDAKRLWKYLCDNYGKNIISGQYTDGGAKSNEYKTLVNMTGKAPAIWGFDMMDYSPSRVRYGTKPSSVDNAIEWAKDYDGIVTFCWHWTPNEAYLFGNTKNHEWWRGFYTEHTTYDVKAVMNGSDADGYKYLLEDIDAIAVQLKRLQDEGIAVLWRPLHEASGGWFWWGTDRDSYLKLWNLLYDRLTNYHKLNNLIWVWNGGAADWYPGDETVDIIGEDIYPENNDNTSQMARFLKAKKYTTPAKMICLSENGAMPDIENCKSDNAMWSWFATWGGNYITNATPKETVIKIFNSKNVITLDEVPDLSKYPLDDTDTDINTDTDSDTDSDTDIEAYVKGDINADEVLDITDVVMARSSIIGRITLSRGEKIRGDINEDGYVDILDVVIMRNLILIRK